MKKHIAEELPARKFTPAAAPPAATKGNKSGDKSPESKIRQAVYDIRYRARREDVPLVKAFSEYMSNSSLGSNERAAVKKKLFGDGQMKNEEFIGSVKEFAMESVSDIMLKVFAKEAIEAPKKYKVRVEDKSGKTYVRYADRDKITQLRANPNIRSVEMTEYGEPYEGERKKGEDTARALGGGGKKAKRDYDGDGKVESGSKEHAGAVHNAIQRRMGGTPDGKDTRKTVSASYEPEGEVIDEAGGRHGGGSMVGQPSRDRRTPKEKAAAAAAREKSIRRSEAAAEARFGKPPRKPSQSETENVEEALIGNQEKIDVAAPYGKLDAKDFRKLRQTKKKKVKEEVLWVEGKTPKIDILPKDVTNKVTVFPSNNMTEKMNLATADMGDVIKDFRGSNKPQFKGKSKKKKQQMAIAAKLEAERKAGMKEEYDSPVDRFRSRLDDESNKKATAKKEKEEMDIRSLPTTMNLFKNKMRAVGLKCSNEPEGEFVAEDPVLDYRNRRSSMVGSPGPSIPGAKNKYEKPTPPTAASTAEVKRTNTTKAKPNSSVSSPGYDTTRIGGYDLRRLSNSYEPEGEVIDERARERRGQPRPNRNRAIELMRSNPEIKKGLMTRSGRTVSQHEDERGVPERDRPQPETSTPAERLARKKAQRERAAAAAADAYKPRAGESD